MAIHKWKLDVTPATHLRRRMGTAQSASIGDLTLSATRIQQSGHNKLVVGNWNITSLTRKGHQLVDEAKLYSMDAVGISSTMHRGSNAVELDDE